MNNMWIKIHIKPIMVYSSNNSILYYKIIFFEIDLISIHVGILSIYISNINAKNI